MEDLNLHFTGDIHAIGAANNLLAAMIDASILHGNPHKIDALRIGWRRAVDMNDRALRQIVVGLGGRANGYPRETGFDITAASEVMAIMAVATRPARPAPPDRRDHRGVLLRRRQADHRRGSRRRRRDDRAAQGRAQAQPRADARGPAGDDALRPVREHRPRQQLADRRPDRDEARRLRRHRVGLRLRHGDGEVLRHRLPVRRADAVGRGARHHRARDQAPRRRRGRPARRSRRQHRRRSRTGMANVRRHLGIIRTFGVPAVVAVNRRPGDTDEEVELVKRLAIEAGAFAAEINEGFDEGRGRRRGPGRGRRRGLRAAQRLPFTVPGRRSDPGEDRGGRDQGVRRQGRVLLPRGRAEDRAVQPRRARATSRCAWPRPTCRCRPTRRCSTRPRTSRSRSATSAPTPAPGGSCRCAGDIQQMPGLGKTPAALNIDIDDEGRTVGLF